MTQEIIQDTIEKSVFNCSESFADLIRKPEPWVIWQAMSQQPYSDEADQIQYLHSTSHGLVRRLGGLLKLVDKQARETVPPSKPFNLFFINRIPWSLT